MKKLPLILLCFPLLFSSCKKDKSSPNINTSGLITITTPGTYFEPSLATCNVGDTIIFNLGSNHNALEVNEENYNNNNAAFIDNGFYFDFGETGYFIPNESKIYYYVCAPHLPDMKGVIIVE
jgi:plastocyanin